MFRSLLARLWHEIAPALLMVAVVLLARTALAQPYYVPSGSMEPTLQIGDELLANKFTYGYSRYSLPVDLPVGGEGRLFARLPARGDVVVFRPPNKPDEVYVKRLIGLPGDRIAMRQGRLWIDGRPLPLQDDGIGQVELRDGRRLPARRLLETLPGGRVHPILKLTFSGPLDNTPEVTVPPGMLFMMGDDRDNSLDSRIPRAEGGLGFVPEANLLGRAEVVLGSWDFPIMAQPVTTWLSGLRLRRFFSKIS